MHETLVGGFRVHEIQCPVCGADNYIVVGYRGGDAHPRGLGIRSRIVRCRECAHMYPNPYPQPEDIEAVYGDPGEYFENHPSADAQLGKTAILDLLQSIRQQQHPGNVGVVTLLDIGAGRGDLVKMALDRGWQATGVEPVGAFVEVARSQYGVVLDHGFFQTENYAPAAFDCVVLSAVLEHVPDPRALLSGIHRVLKPGGLLFLDIPNEASPAFKLANFYYRLRGRDWTVNLAPTFPPFHVQGFGRKSIQRLLDSTGFDIASQQSYAGDVCDVRAGLLPRLERFVFSLVTTAANVAGDGAYLQIVAQSRS